MCDKVYIYQVCLVSKNVLCVMYKLNYEEQWIGDASLRYKPNAHYLSVAFKKVVGANSTLSKSSGDWGHVPPANYTYGMDILRHTVDLFTCKI